MRMKPSSCSTPCAATWRTTSASPGVQLQVGPGRAPACVLRMHCLLSQVPGKCCVHGASHSTVLRNRLQHALLAAMCCWVPAARRWSGCRLPAASDTCACLPWAGGMWQEAGSAVTLCIAGCEHAVECVKDIGSEPLDVQCRCGSAFCFTCHEEAHRPVRVVPSLLLSALVSSLVLSSQLSVLWPCPALPAEIMLGPSLTVHAPLLALPSVHLLSSQPCTRSLQVALRMCRTHLMSIATPSACRWIVRQ